MTVLVDNNSGAGSATSSTSTQNPELEQKVFKVLVAFSQSLEKSLITSSSNLEELSKQVGAPISPSTSSIKQINQITIDNGNVGLYTVQMVRCIIQRADELSKQIEILTQNNSRRSQNNNKQPSEYEKEIESLKEQIKQLKSNNNATTNIQLPSSSSSSETVKSEQSPPLQQPAPQQQQQQTTKSELQESKADWDTKYQTELQLNEMLSEFLKEDFELSNSLGEPINETEPIDIPSSSSTTTTSRSTPMYTSANNLRESYTSASSTPNVLSSSGTFSNSPLNQSVNGGSPSASYGSLSSAADSPSRHSTKEPKKAMLTDLLDQIDLESNNTTSSPSSKEKDKKKGKFKFF